MVLGSWPYGIVLYGMAHGMVYIPMRGRGIEETAAVRAGAPPRRYEHMYRGKLVWI